MKLSVKGLGLAIGCVWALGVFVLGILAWLSSWGVEWVNLLGAVYRGYSASLVGSVIGAVWAFVDGAIGGVIVAWLYNKFTKNN